MGKSVYIWYPAKMLKLALTIASVSICIFVAIADVPQSEISQNVENLDSRPNIIVKREAGKSQEEKARKRKNKGKGGGKKKKERKGKSRKQAKKNGRKRSRKGERNNKCKKITERTECTGQCQWKGKRCKQLKSRQRKNKKPKKKGRSGKKRSNKCKKITERK